MAEGTRAHEVVRRLLQAEKEGEERLAAAEERARRRLVEAGEAAERHRQSTLDRAQRELREALDEARGEANEQARGLVDRELRRWQRRTEAAAELTDDIVAEVVAWVCGGPAESVP